MQPSLVYLTVLVIATCGLVYELVAGTLASYVLGDSVTQFSTVIGTYLSALGLGSWLSRFVHRGVARRFVDVELAVALLGGYSAAILFVSFSFLPMWFRPALYGTVTLVGMLVGLEIPLVLRILREAVSFKDLVAHVLTFDYLGALAASLLFPLVMVPRLGLVRTALLFGLLNAVVALWSTWLFKDVLGPTGGLRARACVVLVLLVAGFSLSERITEIGEEQLYADEVVLARTTRYQRIVLTRTHQHFQLFLNGNLQFSSADEYRYHEALVHPALALVPQARRALVLGGGDGLAVREILKHPRIDEVVLVDLDPGMTDLGRDNPLLRELNHDSLRSPRVRIVNEDALIWLGGAGAGENGLFDAAFVDFPDPHSFSLGKLYTRRFYALLRQRVDPDGVVALQTTSPLFARQSYWCINRTLAAAGFHVRPYHALVPSFGEWGFALARKQPFEPPTAVAAGLRYLDGPTLASLFVLGPDMSPVDVEVNRLDNQVLVRYYENEWRSWN